MTLEIPRSNALHAERVSSRATLDGVELTVHLTDEPKIVVLLAPGVARNLASQLKPHAKTVELWHQKC